MLSTMRRRTSRPVPDVFETFAHRVDSGDDRTADTPRVARWPRSAGITVGLMVLTSVAFVAGAWLAGKVRPELVFANLLWEGVAITVWSVAWGALAAMVVLAVGVVAVSLPWVRRQRDERADLDLDPVGPPRLERKRVAAPEAARVVPVRSARRSRAGPSPRSVTRRPRRSRRLQARALPLGRGGQVPRGRAASATASPTVVGNGARPARDGPQHGVLHARG